MSVAVGAVDSRALSYRGLKSDNYPPYQPAGGWQALLDKQSITAFVIRRSGSAWIIRIDDRVFSFQYREDAIGAAIDVARDLDVSADIFVEADGAVRELVWTSDPVKLLRDMYRIWLAAGRRPGWVAIATPGASKQH
jgi:hypothetical protein